MVESDLRNKRNRSSRRLKLRKGPCRSNQDSQDTIRPRRPWFRKPHSGTHRGDLTVPFDPALPAEYHPLNRNKLRVGGGPPLCSDSARLLATKGVCHMPLFEVETTSHIMIACAEDADAARSFAVTNYPAEEILHVTHRPRDAWVISKKLLGIQVDSDPCQTARDCLARAAGDKLHAVRLYMQATGTDLDGARKAVESNMSRGW